MNRALFGPSGNSESFYKAGFKRSDQEPLYLNNMGLDAYEYPGGNGLPKSIGPFQKIRLEAEKYQTALSLHAPYYISLSGVEEEKRLNSLKYIGQSILCCEAMGGDTIVIHAGSASKISRSEALALAKDTLQRALSLFDTSLHLGIETMGKVNQLGTLEEVTELCSISKRLFPVVDFGHLNARNQGGLFKTAEDYQRVFEYIGEKLGEEKAKHLHCHFSKIEYTEKGEKRHLTFEDDTYGPPFEPLMECIAKNGYFPRIICESAGTMAEDALQMKKYYESLYN